MYLSPERLGGGRGEGVGQTEGIYSLLTHPREFDCIIMCDQYGSSVCNYLKFRLNYLEVWGLTFFLSSYPVSSLGPPQISHPHPLPL